MADNEQTKGELTAEEKRQKRLNNLRPFAKTGEEITEEERERQRELRSKGGKARVAQIEKQKTLRELANELLNAKVSRERAEKVLGELAEDISEESLTNGALLLGAMLNEALDNRTVKSAEFLRDTSGQKPTTEVSLTADVTTDNDRALMANIAERLGILPKESGD